MTKQNATAPQKPSTPGIGDVWQQLLRDLFGKDVENAATYTYGWLADQVGHFTLGFVGVFLLAWMNDVSIQSPSLTGTVLAIIITLIFVGIETMDYISQKKQYEQSNQVFQFNGPEIVFNCFTAVYYIAIGAIVAACALSKPLCGLISFVVGGLLFAGFAIWWLERKICFQQADLPNYFRLAFFKNDIAPATATFIADLANPSAPGDPPQETRHLIIAGPLSSGKSSLATAIGTEFAVRTRMGIGRYMTLAKLIQAVQEDPTSPNDDPDDTRILWPWQSSELLIVDDVDVLTEHVADTPTSSQHQLAIVKERTTVITSKLPADIRDTLKYRRTVWVIGNVDDGELASWKDMLAGIIGITSDKLTVCRFEQKLAALDADRARPAPEERVQL